MAQERFTFNELMSDKATDRAFLVNFKLLRDDLTHDQLDFINLKIIQIDMEMGDLQTIKGIYEQGIGR